MFIETSAKAGFNVKALFKKIAQALPGMDAPGTENNSMSCLMKRLISRPRIPRQQLEVRVHVDFYKSVFLNFMCLD